MGAPYNDGAFGGYPTGAPIVTMGVWLYKANNLKINKATETVNITDQDGAHAGAVSFPGPKTGTIDLQYANVNVPDPNVAAINAVTGVFALNIDNVNVNVFVTGVDIEKPQRGPWTASCTWQAKVN